MLDARRNETSFETINTHVFHFIYFILFFWLSEQRKKRETSDVRII